MSLHELYDQAGQPAARLISKDIFRLPNRLENVSHQTVSAMLHGTTLPAWGKVKSIVVALAQRGELDAEEKELDRHFKPLWVAARGGGRPAHRSAGVQTLTQPTETQPTEPRLGLLPELKPPAPMHPERLTAVIRSFDVVRPRIESSRPVPAEPIVGGLPDRDASFTGREAMLDRMRAEMLANPHAPMVLHGLSGVGKSHLAREYVERYLPDHLVTWWVQADQVERARRSLLDLADRLGTRMGQSAEQTIESVIKDLQALPAPYLLVFDGVNDEEVRRLMPNFGGHVIVTTCDPTFGHESTSVGLEVPDFTVDEAVAFLRKRDVALTEERAMELVGKIGRLPLALEHIAALRRAPGLSWEELQQRLEHTAADDAPAGSPSTHPPEVLASIKVALEAFHTADPAAMLVLELFAWFGSEPVSVALLRQGRAGDVSLALWRTFRNPVDLPKALRSIQQFGLARLHADQRVEVQPVTRGALRAVLSQDALDRARHNVHEILAAADQGRPDDVVSIGMHREIAAHVLPADLIRSKSPEARQTVYHQIRYRYIIGDYAGACALADSTVSTWGADPDLGPADELVLQATREWANALRGLGRYQEARDLTADAMSRLRADPEYGEDHYLTLDMSSSHASDLRLSGEYRRALEIDSDTLGRCLRQYGDLDARTSRRRHNLAVSLRHLGEFGRAEATDREALAYHRENYGVDDWRTLLSVHALAEDMYGLGQYAQVLDLQPEYAGTGSRLPAQLDRAGLLFRRTLALAHRGLGAVAEALEMLHDHYGECNVTFGSDHEYTLAAMLSYANTLHLHNAVEEADVWASDAETAYVRTFGRRHPLTLGARVNRAAILRAKGQRTPAQQLDAVASEALRDTLGDRHPFTISAIANLATDYSLAGGRSQVARALSEDAYTKAREVRGEDHPDTLSIAANLVLDLAAVGETSESEALREDVLVRTSAALGDAHFITDSVAHKRRIDCLVEPPSA